MNAQKYVVNILNFIKTRSRCRCERAPLILTNDPTRLYLAGAGMQPMIPYLLGEAHPEGKNCRFSNVFASAGH